MAGEGEGTLSGGADRSPGAHLGEEPIREERGVPAVVPNLADYEATRRSFTWDQVRRELEGLPDGRGFNLAHEAVDRHARGARGERMALRCLRKDGSVADFTYRDLARESSRFANLLRQLGVAPGDRVFALAGRIPEIYVAALGTLKHRSVLCPLFAAFGPEPIFERLSRGDARVLVTTQRLYRQKVAGLRARLPELRHVLLTDRDADQDPAGGVLSLPRLMASAADEFRIPPTDPEDMALLHFTSGTTGAPKGAVHVHDAVRTHYVTGKYALDLRPGDVFWCTADPGWVTGTSYGIIAPLLHAATNIADEADFDAERWYGILEKEKVNVWYTAPTAIRMLMRLDIDVRSRYDLGRLRLIASVGEPLNPEAVLWGQRVLGLPIHDNWWQTETGGIMISNFRSMDIRPGSMGRPLPGVVADIVEIGDDGTVNPVPAPDRVGHLALRPGWPSMFRGYLHDEARYAACFRDGFYITGDLARRDRDGYFWFVGRADDIIKTAGHMVGPFEVESVMMEHPAVAEAGVIGKPDPTIGEIVKAFVLLRPGFEASQGLQMELIGFARQKLGSAIAPKEIAFTTDLPKTRSGKIMRRLLRARELGLPEGDLSTLEVPAHE